MNFVKEIRMKELPQNQYFSEIPAIKNLEKLSFNQPITFFMGENGSGKSTLLEAIAVNLGFNAEGGSRNFNFATKETHSSLHDFIRVARGARKPEDTFFLRAESFYNLSTYLEEVYNKRSLVDYYGGVPHCRSHGQAFLDLVLHRFRANGLYILDEPEAALSPQNQLTFMAKTYQLAQEGAQFLIATHSPILTALPNAEIYEFGKTIQKISYRDSESYHITKLMLEDTDRLLYNLLKNED